MNSTPITIHLDTALHQELDARLAEAGLSLSTYVTLAVKQLVIQKRIPFEIITPETAVPSTKTRQAMVLTEAKELGMLPDDSPAFNDVGKMMAYLDHEE